MITESELEQGKQWTQNSIILTGRQFCASYQETVSYCERVDPQPESLL